MTKSAGTTVQQRLMLDSMVRESARRRTVQLPGKFAYDEASRTPPLKSLVGMGSVALKLYLTLVLATLTKPHKVYRGTSAARFARMLGFDEADADTPASPGTRRVQRALVSLDKKGFITRTPRPGRVDEIKVNHFDDEDLRPPYVTLPLSLWRNGWINAMSPTALAVYVALRHRCRGTETDDFHVAPVFRAGYGLSEETWAVGSAALEELGLLTVTKGNPEDRDVPRRKRTVYHLHSDTMDNPLIRRTSADTAKSVKDEDR